MTIITDAQSLREAANNLGKRNSSAKLYQVLIQCMAMAERLDDSERERETLLQEFKQQNTGGNRRYIESSSDNCLLVCRYVFHNENDRSKQSAAWRYGISLKVAKSMGFNSNSIGDALSRKGGINAFFQRRKQPNPLVRAKMLRLTEQIEIPSNRPFTLTLTRLPDNVFEVGVLDVSA